MKKKPGIEQAKRFILQLSEDGRLAPGAPLPSIRLLAHRADVSYVTMWKAVGSLKEGGYIIASAGSGRNILSGTSAKEPRRVSAPSADQSDFPDISAPLWDLTSQRMEKDILSGRFSAGTLLPSSKELQNHYGVSFPTLKKTLFILGKKGLIRPSGRGFEIPSLTGASSHTRIAALGCGWEDGSLWIDYLDKNYFRLLENACIQSGIGLDMGVYYQKKQQLTFTRSSTREPFELSHPAFLGFVCIIANLEVPPETVISHLLSLGRPVAVLDVVGGWDLPPRMKTNRNLQVFTVTASRQPGVQAARYLLLNRHRHIAYISPFHKSLWSRQRLDGIHDTFGCAGLEARVNEYVLDRYAYQWDYLQSGSAAADIRSVIGEFEKAKKFRKSALWRKFGNMSYSISRYLTEWNCASGEIYHQMRPLFEAALAQESTTAWVMANDYSALLALDFLREKGVRVPEDLMMISFDNTRDAMEHQLTSFDFNHTGLIHHILRYILWPVSRRKKAGKGTIEVEGVMIERRSSGLLPE